MVIKISNFHWDESNVSHIARHNITPDEVEEAFLDAIHRKGREGRLLSYGKTDAGRYIFIVAVLSGGSVLRVITARDMTKSERRYYLQEKGGSKK